MHYSIPPLERLDVDDLLLLIRQWKYFVLHAPRQTGKTSALLALRDQLNLGGEYRCVYVNVEGGQTARENVREGVRAILSALARAARHALDDDFVAEIWPETLTRAGPYGALAEVLSRWAHAGDKPLVLLIDEIDALIGDTLLSVLRQLRAGYPDRPRRFPQSVILCGVHDVRDYRIRSAAENQIIAGGSAFNIKAKSLRLGDFSRREVDSLLGQHTEETGQAFTDESEAGDLGSDPRATVAGERPGTTKPASTNKAGRDRSREITGEAIQNAREQLILRRETHLDHLTDKLQEERVRRVIEPLLRGADAVLSISADDLEYVRDLGLVARDRPLRVANPIYREVIPRDLTWTTQEMTIHHDPAWYVDDAGVLQAGKLLAAFQEFFREHSEHWVERFQYKEAGPQLLLQAFLQRIVKNGSRIEREYGLGRRRTDLLIVWPVGGDAGKTQAGPNRPTQKVVVECKVLHRGLDETLREGLAQTRAYMDRCAAAEGHLVIFDRTKDKPWVEKIYRRDETEGSVPVTVWGM